MEASLLSLVARLVGFAATSAPMPATTFFLVQLVVAVLVRLDRLALPPEVAWTVSFIAVGVGLVGAVFEWVAKLTDEVDELLRDLHLDRVMGALGTFAISAMLVLSTSVGEQVADSADRSLEEAGVPPAVVEQLTQMGLDWADHAAAPEDDAIAGEVVGPDQEAAEEDLAQAVALVSDSERPPWQKILILLLAVGLNYGLTTLRAELWERLEPFLEGLSLERVARFFEVGGALAALLLVALAPIILLILLAITVTALVVFLLVLRGVDKLMDRRRRQPCPHCSHLRRKEACLCTACQQTLEPTRWLVRRKHRGATEAP
jgi:hypothetical protein